MKSIIPFSILFLISIIVANEGMSMGKADNITIDKERQVTKERGSDHMKDTEWTFVVVQEHPEWEPGIPQLMRQTVLHNDGNVQISLIVDNDLKELKEFQSSASSFKELDFKSISSLKDLYVAPSDEDMGLIIEGYPTTIKFILFGEDGYRIIDSELSVMPESLSNFKNRIQMVSSNARSIDHAGIYIAAQPLGAVGEKEVIGITKPLSLPSDTVGRLPSLARALQSPSVFVRVPEGEMKDILKVLNLDSSAASHVFVMQDWGIAKINFYEKKD